MLNMNAFSLVARQAIRSPSCNRFKAGHVLNFSTYFVVWGCCFDMCNCFQINCPEISRSILKFLEVFCDFYKCFVISGYVLSL